MCAIAGMIGLNCPEETASRMLRSMRRRGPDEGGVFREKDVTLLHRRLAIVDPAGGRQPMELTWGRCRYVMVYNGELYNTQELRRELEELGHHFLSRCDTEVVLHAYAEWREDCLFKLNGIFAFGVYDGQGVFLARDRIGVKPLFYTVHREGLIFASEIKTVLEVPTVTPGLTREGAAELLLLGPGRIPGSGVFRGIRELEPGCWGYFQNGRLKTDRYWKLRDREHTDSLAETSEKIRFLVTDAIRRQMVSDVPIGTFLSGGLDSSLISAVCTEALNGAQLKTFSVDYENNDRYFKPGKFQPDSDGDYIGQMVDFLGSRHYRTVLTPEDLESALEDATLARDLPGMGDVDFSLLAFCRQVRREVTVALSGECADEIFGGYPWYRDPAIRDRDGFPWAQNTARRERLLAPRVRENLSGEEFVRELYLQTVRESDILPGTDPVNRRMKEMVNLNFRWFMQTLLDRKDRMSMYWGLEVRVPFCDYRIAEYLYGVPWAMKDLGGREKGLLRHAMEGILPERVLWRKKSPYPKTWDPRYEQLMVRRMEQVLREDGPLLYLVSREELQALLTEDDPWPWYGQLMRRPQTLAYLLQLDFWLRHYRVNFCF